MISVRRAVGVFAASLAPMLATGCVQFPQRTVCAPMAVNNYHMPMSPQCQGMMNAAQLAEDQGNLMRAKHLYVAAFQHSPHNAECAHRLGIVCSQLNQPDESERYFLRSYSINPNNSTLLTDMGCSAFQRRDFAKAESFLEQSVRLNPSDRQAIENLAIARAWCRKDESSLVAFQSVFGNDDAVRRVNAIRIARGDTVTEQSTAELMARLTPPVAKSELTAAVVPSASNPQPSAVDATPTLSQAPIELPAPTIPVAINENHNLSNPGIWTARTNSVTAVEPLAFSPTALPQSIPMPLAIEVPANLPELDAPIELPAPLPADDEGNSNDVQVATAIDHDLPSLSSSAPALLSDLQSHEVITLTSAPPLNNWRMSADFSNGQMEADRQVYRMPLVNGATAKVTSSAGNSTEPIRFCMVTLHAEGRLVEGSDLHSTLWKGRRYCFTSTRSLRQFEAAPQHYALAADGIDLVAAADGQPARPGVIEFARWYRERLFVFDSHENAEKFSRNPQRYAGNE